VYAKIPDQFLNYICQEFCPLNTKNFNPQELDKFVYPFPVVYMRRVVLSSVDSQIFPRIHSEIAPIQNSH